jgi:DNA-directed RNA polymerase subunit beta'
MLAAQNILNPKDGKPVVTPSQDMVLGNYYLTLERQGARGEGSVFYGPDEVLLAYTNGHVHLHSRIAISAASLNNQTFTEEQNKMLLLTTVGKVIFNEILPEEFPYINEPTDFNLQVETPAKYFVPTNTDVKKHFEDVELVSPFKKKILGNIIAEVFKQFHITETSKMLDRMKALGFKHSTRAGITIGISDIVVLPDKGEILEGSTSYDYTYDKNTGMKVGIIRGKAANGNNFEHRYNMTTGEPFTMDGDTHLITNLGGNIQTDNVRTNRSAFQTTEGTVRGTGK